MLYSTLFLAAAASVVNAATQACAGTAAVQDGIGNYYCRAVDTLSYANANHKSKCKKVKSMANGFCDMVDDDQEEAPLYQDVSLHFRGPLCLKQFAAYKLDDSTTQKRASRGKRHLHSHAHAAAHDKRERFLASQLPPTPPAPAYNRTGYYNAEQQVAEGISFLGHYGGQGSGAWDAWGNSLSYLNSAANAGSPTPQILANECISSNKEFAIFTDRDFPYGVRPGSVDKYGFDGADKVFIAEFKMPLDGDRGFNGDLPAYWMLNAAIPRSQQYGSCSCWPCCGEFDIIETLDKGDLRCKSTFHSAFPGGSSDYFNRPVGEYIKVATIIDAESSTVTIKVLPSDTEVGPGLTKEQVQGWINLDDPSVSLFTISAS